MNWMTHLPRRWSVVPLRRVLRGIEQGWSPVAEDRSADDGEWGVIKLSAVSPAGFVSHEHKALAEGTVPERRFEIRDGDVLLTRANTPDLVGEACVVRAARPHLMLCDLVYRLNLDLSAMDPRYLVHWLGSGPGRSQVEADARGSSQSMVKVSQGHIRSWLTPTPPIPEQRAIADFLDRKTAAIDASIRHLERVEEFVEEARKVRASAVLARGLHPDVPLRDSGIEWLGTIPRHWRVMKTRRLCSLTTGGRDTQDAVEAGAYPFFVRSDTVERIDTYSFDGEGVLTSGDGVGVGKVFHHYVGKLEFHQRVYLYYGFKDVLGRFYYHFLREWLGAVVFAGTAKSTVDSLRRPMLLEFPVAVPPVAEQQQIVAFLDTLESNTVRLQQAIRRQRERLREYRQTLITAAVTGQLDIAAQEAA